MIGYWLGVLALLALGFLAHVLGIVRFETHWTGWLVAGLVLLSGGWMAFDGIHAFATGEYVTPGPTPGRLGPWAGVVEKVGIDPRSNLMRGLFVGYGLAYLAATAALVTGAPWGWRAVLVAAVLGLWYVPFGTLLNLIVIGVLFTPHLLPGG